MDRHLYPTSKQGPHNDAQSRLRRRLPDRYWRHDRVRSRNAGGSARLATQGKRPCHANISKRIGQRSKRSSLCDPNTTGSGRDRRACRGARENRGNSDHILRALFERTYAALTPGGQRVFLLLCSWRVLVPRIAIEATLLRPEAERFNVSGAIDELERFSLVDCFLPKNEHDGGTVSVPLASLAATTYGRGKLEASPFSVSVEQDRKLLMEFGPGRTTDSQRSVLPRIQSHYQAVAKLAQAQPEIFEERRPVLEYLAMRVPRAYLQLADLVTKIENTETAVERAKEYVYSVTGCGTDFLQWKWAEMDRAVGEVAA